MRRYRIRLTAVQPVETYIEVTSETEDEAIEEALDMGDAGCVDWQPVGYERDREFALLVELKE